VKRLAAALPFATLGLALVAWWGHLAEPGFREQFFSADVLVWPTVLEDVLGRGHALWNGWHLTPAPYFFPDGFLAATARGVFTRHEARQYACVIAQVLLLAGAFASVVRSTGVALTAIVVALALTGREPFTYFLLPSFHVGAVMACLGVAALVTQRRGGPGWALLIAATAASDVLVLVFVLGGCAMLVAATTREERRALRRPVAWAVVPALLGAGLSRLLPFADRESHDTRFAEIPATIVQAASQAWRFEFLFQALFLAGMIALVVLARKRQPLTLFFLGGTVFNVGAVIASGNLAGGAWHRYLLASFAGGLVALALLLPRGAIIGLAFLIVVPMLRLEFPTSVPESRLRAEVACLDALARDEDSTGVITDYWNAKPIALFSKAELSPATFMPLLDAPQIWVTSHAWYTPPRGFAFVVFEGINEEAFRRELDFATEEKRCGRWPVFVYRGEAKERLTRFVTDRLPAR
jgi:hypothetical protein